MTISYSGLYVRLAPRKEWSFLALSAREAALKGLGAFRRNGAWPEAFLNNLINKEGLSEQDAALASRLCCSAGSTTLSAVPSIKAIADASIAETMIHLPAGLPNETVAMFYKVIIGTFITKLQ